MSNTRKAQPGSEFRQERFASSAEYNRGLMANLVAQRCAALDKQEQIELVWFLQMLSHSVGMVKLAQKLIAFRDASPARKKRKPDLIRIHGELIDTDIENCSPEQLAEELTNLCLDPKKHLDRGPYYFSDLIEIIGAFKASWIEQRTREMVVTSIGRTINETLDYALEARCVVAIDGVPRIGKSHAAEAWCELHPGQARYFKVPSYGDDISFFRAIAKCLGVSINLNSKAQQLRHRIEDVLQSGCLMLVADDCHFLWPNNVDPDALPNRINWLMSALIDHGVPIGLIVSPQFNETKKIIEHRTRWRSEQWDGRIGHTQPLPDVVSRPDLENVAGVFFPELDKDSIKLVADHAVNSRQYLYAFEAISDRAHHLARHSGRDQVNRSDIVAVISERRRMMGAPAVAEPRKDSFVFRRRRGFGASRNGSIPSRSPLKEDRFTGAMPEQIVAKT
jgi:hypothetical protein